MVTQLNNFGNTCTCDMYFMVQNYTILQGRLKKHDS